jgi:hypothetical protein
MTKEVRMLINGKEYSEKQISEMEKFWRKRDHKNKSGKIDKIKDNWPDGEYMVHYSDGSKIVKTFKSGEKLPLNGNLEIVSVIQILQP